jgi:hypothetical protein
VAVERKGADLGGWLMAAKSTAERWSMGVRMDGYRSRPSCWQEAGDDGEA